MSIGLEGPASTSGLAAAADASIVEDENQPILPFFLENETTDLLSNTVTGASWYILNTASNGLADDNGQCARASGDDSWLFVRSAELPSVPARRRRRPRAGQRFV